jgi:5-methylcytosine-specific restriction enzyme A
MALFMEDDHSPPNQNDPNGDTYYILNPEDTDPKRIKKEREKAQKLKKSQWWKNLLNQGICHYCQKKFPPLQLTMDHVVPLARGGLSNPGNIVPSCKDCNRNKKLHTPVDQILKDMELKNLEKDSKK